MKYSRATGGDAGGSGIAIIGTLDTKGEAIAYVRDEIVLRGHRALVIDVGLRGAPFGQAAVTREMVARASGCELADLLRASDKGRAVQAMAEGARVVLAQRHGAGEVGGAIALGGGQGAAMGSFAMQGLPLGVPKLLVTTMASGRNLFEPYVGTTDMVLMHSVSDIVGVDPVSTAVLRNAAAAIGAMVCSQVPIRAFGRPVVGASMLGLTTGCVMGARDVLLAAGCDVVPFHANGTGGRCLERLVDDDLLAGVLDVSVQELVGNVCGGLFDGGPGRLTAAASRGVPQVVVPGGADYLVLGPLDSLSAAYRSRPHIVHNPNITLVRTTAAEMAEVGQVMALRLNHATAPVVVAIPMGGFSQADVAGGPFEDPAADAALVNALRRSLTPSIELVEVDDHINGQAFARLVGETMLELMGR